GVPKQPTVTVCQWIDGEYQMQQFRRGDRLSSSIFPELQLDTSQIFDAGI
ncbi:MAG: Uma2 family endonuclease, partial [Cyanobacteria bacterium P01_C01_bin.147]